MFVYVPLTQICFHFTFFLVKSIIRITNLFRIKIFKFTKTVFIYFKYFFIKINKIFIKNLLLLLINN